LLLFFLSLPAYSNVYLLRWIPGGRSWTVISRSLGFGAAGPADPTAWVGLIGVWIFLLVILLPVGQLIGIKPRSWIAGFTVIFWISMLLWIASFYTPLIRVFGSSEIGWVFALIIGIAMGNWPTLPQSIRQSAKGEFFIKTAIVLLGAKILFTTLVTVILPVLEVVFLAFPVVWVIAYTLSRRLGMDQKFAATLSSGVGICGISAAIATAGAIEAPGIYATMVSSIIVVFAAIELIILPYLGAYFFPHHMNAAGVWMALSVKTDGAAAASGAVVSGLLGQGPSGVPAIMAVTTKILMDVWIGLIALILAAVFAYFIEKKPASKVDPMILWYRFPKFVLGYFFTSLVLSAIAFTYPTVAAGAKAVGPVSTFGTSTLQVIFFSLTFTSIGITTRFSALKQVGLRKPFTAYFIAMLVAILWGGILAYAFFGALP
jgi:uncharacterized membrane protein YadS